MDEQIPIEPANNAYGPEAVGRALRRIVDFTYLVVLGIFALGILMMISESLHTDKFYSLILKNPSTFIDYIKIYTCGKMVSAGLGHSIYDPDLQLQWMNQLVAPAQYNSQKFIQYPPYDFVAAAPLSVLELIPGFVLWTVVTLIVGCVSLGILRRVSGYSYKILECTLLIFLYMSSLFSFNSIILGQTGWLMLAIICLFFIGLLNRNQYFCGAMIFLSTIKPQFLLLLAPPVLIKRMWKTIALASTLEFGMLALTIKTVGLNNFLDYPKVLAHAESALYGYDNERMVCVRGLVSAIFHRSGFGFSAITVICALALSVWIWVRVARENDKKSQMTAISMSVLTFLIFSPHSFLYDCLILSVPTVMMLPDISLASAFLRSGKLTKAFSIVIMTLPLVVWASLFANENWAGHLILFSDCFLLFYLLREHHFQRKISQLGID